MSGFSGFNMGHHVLGNIQAPTAGQTKPPFIIYTYNESVREQRLAQYESDQHQHQHINETLKWLSLLPILMQESFWW